MNMFVCGSHLLSPSSWDISVIYIMYINSLILGEIDRKIALDGVDIVLGTRLGWALVATE